MKIIISGCGKIGTTILSNLVAEGHDIVAIDSNPAVIEEITNVYDVMGVCGNGFDSDILEEADVGGTELFIAAAGSDESNLMSCYLARKLGVKHTIARVRNPEYNDKSLGILCQHFELSLAINPERLAAREIFSILKFPSALKIEYFARGNFELVELKLKNDSIFDGMKISELKAKYKTNVLCCCVLREDKVSVPNGDFVLKSGDRVGFAGTHLDIYKFFKDAGIAQKQSKSVMILGGGRICYYLADMLSTIGASVKIIDKNEEKCSELSDSLPKAIIINADGTQQDLLMEEGLRSVDAFVSLTGMDEQNILISIFASAQDVPKVITKVNKDELATMAEKLGLDTLISPKSIVSDVIIRYARALYDSLGSSVEKLYKFMDGKVEALEYIISEDSKLINIPLKDLKIKKGILIGGIMRDRKPIVPGGNDVILKGDHIVIFAANQKISGLSDIMEK